MVNLTLSRLIEFKRVRERHRINYLASLCKSIDGWWNGLGILDKQRNAATDHEEWEVVVSHDHPHLEGISKIKE